MGRRKGEITPSAILRDFPWHLIFTAGESDADLLRGGQFYRSCAPRSVSWVRHGVREVLICFAEKGDAEAFQRHAGGVLGASPEPRRGEM